MIGSEFDGTQNQYNTGWADRPAGSLQSRQNLNNSRPAPAKGGRKGKIMKKYIVEYKSGDSRMSPGTSVDYMIVIVDDIELYAEAVSQDDESATYDELKASIIEQARKHGIDADILKFWYD